MNKAVLKYLGERAEKMQESLPPPHPSLRMVIVIPAYRENLRPTLESLIACPVSIPEKLEVLLILNRPARDKEEENIRANQELIYELRTDSVFPIHVMSRVFQDEKKAGVGLARKVGMDCALERLVAVQSSDGWIVCLDADCTVSENYISELLYCQENDTQATAGSLYFEHPIPDWGAASAIYQYELHLRYYIEMQRRLNLPYAYHTVGSAMFVKARDYARRGGMNTRKAGEDFYFLHKFTLDGGFRELNKAVVYPSARISKRVPFGTGKAVADFDGTYLTYHPKSFEDLSVFLNWVRKKSRLAHRAINSDDENALPESILAYLRWSEFIQLWEEWYENTASSASFLKRFYQWFNAFRMMKCLHYLRDHYYPSKPILHMARQMLPEEVSGGEEDLLDLYRQMNKSDQWRVG